MQTRLDEASIVVYQKGKCRDKLKWHICNSVVNGFIRASKLEARIGNAWKRGWEPDVIAYRLLIDGLCQGK
ncbi:hypothetical protein TorRG33x02_275650 [Trema orientale]|uniref:Uncharacterized protein n=1 Tax=Trema orientale TaxID=63057 RepID=A0A2P5CRP1_TREOI|nr:hypothetical protein TorRG33x02_275650 [Trema orientale]